MLLELLGKSEVVVSGIFPLARPYALADRDRGSRGTMLVSAFKDRINPVIFYPEFPFYPVFTLPSEDQKKTHTCTCRPQDGVIQSLVERLS